MAGNAAPDSPGGYARVNEKTVGGGEPFLWGAATSSHQVEGNNRHNDWWQWEQQGNIEGGVRSGAATDHWNRFREDLRLAADLGLNSYRFSIEWSRLEPEEGQWNHEALEWYRELIAECERLGLVPMATLLHFTMPRWLSERGGFAWEQAPDKFAGYARYVVKALGPRIPLWCTLNEPNSMVVGAYLGGFMPPAKYKPKSASLASRHLLMAHLRAYDRIHRHDDERAGPWKHWPRRVGIAHNMIDFQPMHSGNAIERLMTHVFRRFYNASWPDAVTGRKQHFGVRALVPYPNQVWEARGRATADFLGINYYTRVYVCWGPQRSEANFVRSKYIPVGVIFSRPEDKTTDMGWSIHPEGLGRMIRFLARYRVPLYITENGIADAADDRRPQYLMSHLRETAYAVKRGADVRGYYYWALTDNFEWMKGFEPRFGLFEVDYENFARKARPSCQLYRRVVAAHRAAGEIPPRLDCL